MANRIAAPSGRPSVDPARLVLLATVPPAPRCVTLWQRARPIRRDRRHTGVTMAESEQPATTFDPHLLEEVRNAMQQYEESGDAFQRARLVSQIGKTYAPALLA